MADTWTRLRRPVGKDFGRCSANVSAAVSEEEFNLIVQRVVLLVFLVKAVEDIDFQSREGI